MNSRKGSSSGIFLMEMIMVCGFFLLCAAVCIRVFIQADSMSRLAREMNQAVLAAESVADRWKVGASESEGPSGGGWPDQISWDQDWELLDVTDLDGGAKAWYTADLARQEAPGMVCHMTIQVRRGEDHPRRRQDAEDPENILYTLEVERYSLAP